jgi:hypothetical protein
MDTDLLDQIIKGFEIHYDLLEKYKIRGNDFPLLPGSPIRPLTKEEQEYILTNLKKRYQEKFCIEEVIWQDKKYSILKITIRSE